jgi:DNA repair protein RecN (Recombination protein N)
MLTELVVNNLGVIRSSSVVLDKGMSAFTGETGAGKTLLVEAIDLLLGGKAEGVFVGPASDEARVDGRFIIEEQEVVLCRVIPRSGRSRAYIDGHPVSVSALAERGSELMDLHGQHANQRLLLPGSQRDALDSAARIDDSTLREIRAQRRTLIAQRATLGGDERSRAREIDLLTYQVDELREARIVGPDEDALLAEEEELLANAESHREALHVAVEALTSDSGVLTLLGSARQALAAKAPFDAEMQRLKAVFTEADDIAAELRIQLAKTEDNPERRAEIRERRQVLRQLRRKYGDTLALVLTFAEDAQRRLYELMSHDARVESINEELRVLITRERSARDEITRLRRAAAPVFAEGVLRHLTRLALPNASFAVEVTVDENDADDERVADSKVIFLFAANPGTPPAPVAKVASGGELARVMLALQLSLLDSPLAIRSPSVLVFDEVDAGIGGETALSVGDALAELGTGRQVLVVTHLAQVAASADNQIHLRKHVEMDATGAQTTVTVVARLTDEERITEVARMLAGDPASPVALQHAKDLLAARRSHNDQPKRANAGRATKVATSQSKAAVPKAAVPKAAVPKAAAPKTTAATKTTVRKKAVVDAKAPLKKKAL